MSKRSIAVVLRAEVDQYKRAMSEASKATEELGDKNKKTSQDAQQSAKSMVDSYAKLGQPLMAVGGAITALGVAAYKTGIQYNTLQQTSRAALTTMLGSAEAASAQMDKLDEFARTSPFAKQAFISAQQQMMAFGIETKKVLPYLDSIQDAVAASGGGNQQLSEIAFIMAQISSAGKITGQDLIQFGQRGVNAAELIGSQMGKTGAQIKAEITAGTLGADEALDALAAGMTEKFEGSADNVKNTFTGALDRVAGAWRDLSSAMAEPLVGKESGGLGTAGLNQLADMLRTIEKLPKPVLAVGGAMTMLAGGTLLAGGGFLTLAPRIVATKAALETMSPAAQKAAGALGTMSKAIGIGAAAITAWQVVVSTGILASDTISADAMMFTRTLSGIQGSSESTADALDTLFKSSGSDGGWVRMIPIIGTYAEAWGNLKQEVTGLDDAFNALDDSSGWLKTGGGAGGDDRAALAAKSFSNLDATLTQLYSSGHITAAADLFDKTAEAGKRQGKSIEEINKLLPNYNATLDQAALSNGTAAGGVDTLATALNMSDAEFAKVTESASKQADAFIGLSKSTTDAKVSFGDWIKDMEKQAKLLQNFTANAETAARNGLDNGLIESLRQLGPEGAFRMEQLANASESEIARANAAWQSQSDAASEYEDSVIRAIAATLGVPDEEITRLMAEDNASPVIDDVDGKMDDLNDKTAKPTIGVTDNASKVISRIGNLIRGLPGGANIPIGANNANGGIYAYANGGMDVRGRTVPRIPQLRNAAQGTVMWGEPETGWEAYISGKPGMEARNQAIWMAAGKKLGMLDGVEAFASGGLTASSDAEYLRLQQSVKQMTRDLAKKNKKGKYKVRGLDRSIMQAELREAQAELAEQKRIRSQIGKGRAYASVDAFNESQGFRDSAFSVDKFTSAAGVERHLQKRLAEMAEFTQLIAQLKGRGASPWLLNELIRIGPSKSTNRVARQYLTDHQALLRVNALSAQANVVSAAFGQLTTATSFNQTQSASILSTAQINQLATIAASNTRSASSAPTPAVIDAQAAAVLANQIASAVVSATRSTFDQKTFTASTPSSAMSGGLS